MTDNPYLPWPVFRRSVVAAFQRSLTGWLEKELKLSGLQRQSAEWGAKCCGIDLNVVFSSLEDALQRRRERKIREQIARELAELEAARKKAGL
jgi:hypothetical protein